jgi:type I restriction enzyme S subunit
MEVKPGYKQTEAGAIPEDWSVQALGDISDCLDSLRVPLNDTQRAKRRGDIPYCGANGVLDYIDGFVVDDDIILIAEDGGYFDEYATRPIAYRMAGKCWVNNHAHILKARVGTDQGLIYFSLVHKNILRFLASGTRAKLNRAELDKIEVPLPPTKAEQEAIAEALSDADALIESLEQLLIKRRQLKQGAMQELLTGKKRLPGFSGEWETKVLENVLQIPVTDGPHLTPRFLNDGIPFLSVNNLVDNRIDLSSLRYISREDHAEFSRKCRPQRGDVLLGKAASVGLVAIVDMDMEFNIWSPIALIRVNSGNIPKFVYYSFQSATAIRQIELLTNSSSQGNIGMGDIERLVLLLPEKEEQQAIADVLSDMDAEIAALETKLAKAHQLKRGMMQELLTGRIRLV